MINVYHNSHFTDYSFKEVDELPGDLLSLVATIHSDDLDIAFRDTNHINQDWTRNTGVTPLVTNPRSTSVGDVMEKQGVFHMVLSCGFKEIKIV